jgi:hypothetical protein
MRWGQRTLQRPAATKRRSYKAHAAMEDFPHDAANRNANAPTASDK